MIPKPKFKANLLHNKTYMITTHLKAHTMERKNTLKIKHNDQKIKHQNKNKNLQKILL